MSDLMHICERCRWYDRDWGSCANLRVLMGFIGKLRVADDDKARKTAIHVLTNGSYAVHQCRGPEPQCMGFEELPTLWQRIKGVLA